MGRERDLMGAPMVSKLDVLAVVAFAGVMLWIEQGHRTRIGAPTEVEVASPAHAAGCPDNDTMPYTANCIEFLEGGAVSGSRIQAIRVDSGDAAPVDPPN
jgi:hypothetical protein